MGEPRVIRVVVVADRQAVRDGLAALLGLLDDVEVAGSAADGAEALALLSRLDRIDAVLVDLTMPVATERIVRDHPGVAVLVLTTSAGDGSITAAPAAGAGGYLTKDAGRGEIGAALRAAVSGRGGEMVRPPDGLTPREAEVLGLIAAGLSNGEIAAELVIAEATVKTHINNAFAKIGVRNRIEALRYAVSHGLGGGFTA